MGEAEGRRMIGEVADRAFSWGATVTVDPGRHVPAEIAEFQGFETHDAGSPQRRIFRQTSGRVLPEVSIPSANTCDV